MKTNLRVAVLAAAWIAGCGGDGTVPGTGGEPGPGLDATAGDAPEPADDCSFCEAGDGPVEDAVPGDQAVEPEVPLTCASVMEQWQCMESSECAAWESCMGRGGCSIPPCLGVCEDYPGMCQGRTTPVTCSKAGDCGGDEVCAGAVYDPEGGQLLSPGLCRPVPGPGACFSDGDCAPGLKCSGELVCRPGGPCLGPEMPGWCTDQPPAGTCFDDDDCPDGEVCAGAGICGDDADCQDEPGVCESAGCWTDLDCVDSPAGSACVGAFLCQDSACTVPDRPGFCAGATGPLDCWGDDDCYSGDAGPPEICRTARPCPPGTACEGHGLGHHGVCGEMPVTSEGVGVGLSVSNVSATEPFWVILLNNGAATLFVDPCNPALVARLNTESGEWQTWGSLEAHWTCGEGGSQGALLAVPSGSGMVVGAVMAQQDAGSTFRVEVSYRLGCSQGVQAPGCRSAPYLAVSDSFVVSKAR